MRCKFQPYGVIVEAEAGQTVLQAAAAGGVSIEAVCGGRGTCGKCRIVATEGLSPLTDAERRKLTPEEIAAGYRLACQALVVGDTIVSVPEESRISQVSILSDGVDCDAALDPWVSLYAVEVPEATIEDQVADLDNIARYLGAPTLAPTLAAARQAPAALRADGGRVTVVALEGRMVRIVPGHAPVRTLGMAFDIGTTTVVGYLMDLQSGEQLAVSSLLNPQTRHGDDVVSRIGYSRDDPHGLENLHRDVIQAMNTIIERATHQAGASPDDIYGVAVVGNTTMQHLFLGIAPEALARSPYVPALTQALGLRAAELGLCAYPDATVWTLPNIAGWVGADTTGVLLATRLHTHEEPALAIDIGTNGEMALGSRERLVTCSTAAGPAFEGAHLSCGMRAADGAIDVVTINHRVEYHVIGEGPARGVCGSGLVDLVAGMLQAGIIEPTGMMVDGEALRSNGHAHVLADRISGEGRQRHFVLVEPEAGAGGRPVLVTQRDVRELQLAKAAIRAGIEILMKELGITHADVKRVYLAGAFGNYIRPASALAIGLIPTFPNAEIVPVGNAAGSGAKEALLSRAMLREATAVLAHVEYLELSGRADFQEEFAEAMLFGMGG